MNNNNNNKKGCQWLVHTKLDLDFQAFQQKPVMREVLSLTGREFFHHDCKRDNYQRLNFARMVLVFKIKSSDCSQQMMMDTTLTTEFYVSSKKCKYGWYLQVFDATVTIKNRLGMTHKRISWSDLHGHEVY